MSNIVSLSAARAPKGLAPAPLAHPPYTDHQCAPLDCGKIPNRPALRGTKAYFDHNNAFGTYCPELVGLEISEQGQPTYLSRSAAIARLGIALVGWLEQHYAAQLNKPAHIAKQNPAMVTQ